MNRTIMEMTNLQPLSKEEREALKISYAEASRHSEISLLRALLTIDELEKEREGFRENASALAVRLGVDPEKMDDAQTWHASAQAIDQIESRQKKLVEALRAVEHYMTRYNGCICRCPVLDGHREYCIVMAALREIGEGD